LKSNKIVFGPGAPTPLDELTDLLQIRWSTGIECDTPFPFSFLSTPSARRLRRFVKGGPKTEYYGDSLMGFGVQKSPVGPGTKPQQGSEDGVGSLGAKAALVSHKTDSDLGLRSRRLVSCSPRTKSW